MTYFDDEEYQAQLARVQSEVDELFARHQRRVRQYRNLGHSGIAKDIPGGCGSVRVNAHGVVVDVELNLPNCGVLGEQELAKQFLTTLRKAEAKAQRISRLIGEN